MSEQWLVRHKSANSIIYSVHYAFIGDRTEELRMCRDKFQTSFEGTSLKVILWFCQLTRLCTHGSASEFFEGEVSARIGSFQKVQHNYRMQDD